MRLTLAVLTVCCTFYSVGIVANDEEDTPETTALTGIPPGSEAPAFAKLTGSLSFRTEKGTPLVVLTVTNRTDKVLWIPFGCEAVNIRAGRLRSHSDCGLCKFPTQYMKLEPKDSHQYVHTLPEGARGKIEMSIWAPWRTADGKLIDGKTKQAALKPNEELIEEVVGVGNNESDSSGVLPPEPADD